MSVPTVVTTPLTAPDPGRPLLVVGPSLGTTTALWEPVAALLDVEVLGVDLPGHGASPVPGAPYTVPELAEAVLSAVDAHRGPGAPFHYAGDSIGGALGLALALRAPDRVRSLAPVCTGAKLGEPAAWHERAALVRAEGTGAVVATSRQRWFAPGFPERAPEVSGPLLDRLREVDPEGYARACEALALLDLRGDLARITAPTVVVSGAQDIPCPPEMGAIVADGVPCARQVVLDGVGHLAPAEAPEAVAAILRDLIRAGEDGRPDAGPSAPAVAHPTKEQP